MHVRVMAYCTDKQKKRLSVQTLNLTVTALPLLQESLQPFNGLLNRTHPKPPHVLKNTRQYNTLLAFTSFETDATPQQREMERIQELRGRDHACAGSW